MFVGGVVANVEFEMHVGFSKPDHWHHKFVASNVGLVGAIGVQGVSAVRGNEIAVSDGDSSTGSAEKMLPAEMLTANETRKHVATHNTLHAAVVGLAVGVSTLHRWAGAGRVVQVAFTVVARVSAGVKSIRRKRQTIRIEYPR